LTIGGDLSGTVTLANPLRTNPSNLATARVTVGGNMSGVLTLAYGMRGAVVDLNTVSGDLTGTITMGGRGFNWTDEDGIVSLSDLIVHGNFKASGEIIFRGCFITIPGTYTFHQYCIEGQQDGTITEDFCAGATVDLLMNCSP